MVETRTIAQVPALAAVSPNARMLVSEPGGLEGTVDLKTLFGKYIATDTATATVADLSVQLAYDDKSIALVFADPDLLKNGWYRKVGAKGAGRWEQFETLSKATRESMLTLSGNGPPAPNLGMPGQFYRDLAANTEYGPKMDAGWGQPRSIAGPAGGDGNSYPDFASLRAAKPGGLTYNLRTARGPISYAYVPGDFTGKADDVFVVKLTDVPLATGALVRQGAGAISFKQPGASAVFRPVEEKLSETVVSVTDFGARGDGLADDTVPCQKAIDAVEAQGGGYVFFPKGTYRCNLIFGHRVKMYGDGRVCTTLKPASALPVIQLPVGKSVTRIGIEDMYLEGDYAHKDADVINLQPSGTGIFADDILLQNVLIQNAGRDGVFVAGMQSIGPFVQRLKMDTCEVRNSQGNNLSIRGTVLETTINHCSFSRVEGTPGMGSSIALEFFNGDLSLRVRLTSCTIDNAALAGTPNGHGLRIGAGGNVSIRSSNFEFCSPAISTSESPFALGFTAIDCNFGFGEDVDTVIHLKRSRSTLIQNCTLRVAAGHKIRNFVLLDGSMSDIRNVRIEGTTWDGEVTNWVNDPNSFYQSISGGVIRKWRDTIVVLGEGAAPFTDDLENIYSDSGGTDLFAMGEKVTVLPFANFETVTVRHGTGNLVLAGGTDYKLDSPTKSITFRWNLQRKRWIEVGRA